MAETNHRRDRRHAPDPKRWILPLLAALCVVLFLFAGYKVVTILWEYNEGQNTYDELSQYVSLPDSSTSELKATPTVAPSSTPSGDTSGLTDWDALDQGGKEDWAIVNFDALQAINDDVVGWIYFPETVINYPVLQGKTNDTYLYRMVNGKSNGAGSIFMDYRNDATMVDPHTIVYGHHMNDGSMFAELLEYKKQEYYELHPTFQYITPDAHYEVEIISAYTASTDQDSWDLKFKDEDRIQSWAERAQKRSRIKTAYTYSPGDQFMTLSTCTYDFEDARFVVVGVIRKVLED